MYNFENTKILVVDDEELIREILSEAFILHGGKVDLAASGNEALKKVKSNDYDIIVTDIRMPNGDGINLIENIIKLNIKLPKLFVCSAYNDLSDERILKLGILKIFTKPFELNYLLSKVYSFMVPEKSL